jgi:hypothetical protein
MGRSIGSLVGGAAHPLPLAAAAVGGWSDTHD